jgi:hypothetical protein
MPWARESLANFITDSASSAVRNEVLDPVRSEGKLFGMPRIFDNLLSSQPLCFNLFAGLQSHLESATAVVQSMGLSHVRTVTSIQFEHSPGRGDPAYTGDRSAFDVFLEYSTRSGQTGFLGVEVKYHENLAGKSATLRGRYEEVAGDAGCFRPGMLPALRLQPLQQIWRDHLLASSLLQHGDYDEGAFVFLSPEENPHCQAAVCQYRECLVDDATFFDWTLESFFESVSARLGDDPWVKLFFDRYLDFAKVREASSVH